MNSTKILKFSLTLCTALALFLLAGCGSDSPPAGQTPSPSAAQPGETKAAEQPVLYVVQGGDTLPLIAWKTGVPVERLIALNGLTEDSMIYTGRRLITGFTMEPTAQPSTSYDLIPRPALSLPTPVSPVEYLEPLTLQSSRGDIRARLLNPGWNTLWLDGSATRYNPDGSAWNFHVQAWLDRYGGGHMLITDLMTDTPIRPPDAPPRWFWASDGRQLAARDLEARSSIDRFDTDTQWRLHPLEGAGPLSDMIFLNFLKRMRSGNDPSRPLAEDIVAGRQAVLVEWGGKRLWVDVETGIVLRMQTFDSVGSGQRLTQEIILNQVRYDVDLPLETHRLIKSNQVLFDEGPAPAGFDPNSSNLVIKYAEFGQPKPGRLFANFAVDIYAGGYYLGFVETGADPLYNCERSPDGSKLAFNYRAEDEEGHPLGSGLRWFDLRDLSVVNDPLPGLRPAAPPIWSTDNRHIAFSACLGEGECGVYVFDTANEEMAFVTHQGYSMWPVVWSPDGKFFMVVVNSLGGEGVEPIWVFELDNGELVYEGEFDAKSWQFPADAPIHKWGVDYPRISGGYEACEKAP